MLPPPNPPDETFRLASLRGLGILDTPPEERFDRVTRLAALVFEVPIALVSLVDANRQWFKSCIGLDVSETSREISFCGHAILSDEALVIPNALADAKFADNPLVTGPPDIRFYAGFPLGDANGQKLGTLCIIDRKPREFGTAQIEILRELAGMAMQELNSIGLESATQSLHEAQTRMQAITEAVVDGLITIDPGGAVTSFNSAAERIFGYARAEIVGQNVRVLMPEPYHAEHDGYLSRFLTTGEARVIGSGREVVGLRKDGSVFPMDLAVSETESGGERVFIGIVRDITERKRVEEERRKFFSMSLDMLCIAGFDGYFKDLNPAWEATLGYSLDELKAVPFIEVIHPDDHAATMAQVSTLGEGGTVVSFENRFRCADGSYRWFLWSATAEPLEGLIYAVARDVTERKHAENELADQAARLQDQAERLRKSEELYRSVISAMEEGVVVHDQDGSIGACNGSAERILGLTAAQITGRSPMDPRWRAVDTDGAPLPGGAHPAMLALRTGKACSGVVMGIHRPGGDLRWISVNARPLVRPGESKPYAAVASFADVTDRLAVERMKSEFVSMVSHELRTPLTSVRGALGLIASGTMGDLPEKPKRMLEIAVSNTDRLIRLINDILDIERMESGQVSLARHEIDAAALLDQAVETMQPLAERSGVTLHTASAGTRLWVDPDRILQTLTNLLGNAIKFSPPGGTVLASVDRDGDDVVFNVTDEGRGIPSDKLETIFERFQQVDASDSREKGGTGLGLAICRSIVEQHGGRIWAQSVVGEGSTFAFVLPALDRDAAVDDLPAPETSVREPGVATVLVCDDDDSVREVVQTQLEEHGYRVINAASGEQAVDLARLHRPDVVLLDLGLPGLSGWQTFEVLKAGPITEDIPIVIFSGTPPDVVGDAAGSGTPADWLTKPVDDRSLFETLERAISVDQRVRRVLLVEDDLDLARVLIETFARHGMEVVHAPTAAEAIELSQLTRPDIVVLDLVLPDGDGFSVVESLRLQDRLRSVPLVVYTAHDLDASERERLTLGTTQFLTKGRVSPDDFDRHVTALLNSIVGRSMERAGR
jgi:PAS domain S-box-containing protein